MEKKKISIIALDPRAGQSYGRDVESLFGDVADVSVFSVMDGTAMGVLPHADLFAASTLKIGGRDMDKLAPFLDKLPASIGSREVNVVMTISADKEELPVSIRGYIM